jgi:zinc/manganese transport system substrate-binding protein
LKRSTIILATAVILIVAVGAAYFAGNNGNALTSSSSTALKGQIQVVAAENFWGSLVSQVGGSKVNVTSIVSDPNTDPHEYESNTANARAIAGASLVIINGAGYDTWAQSLIQASNTPSQVVLNVQLLLKQPIDTNPHFWYSPYFVNDTVNAMYRDLVTIDPTDSSYFRQQYTALNSSLWSSYMMQEEIIRRQFGGAPVASTESIFVYMANATGLNLITPPAFMKEVAEGGEPSPCRPWTG